MYYKSVYKKREENFEEELKQLKKSQQESIHKIDEVFGVKKTEYSQNFDSKFKNRIKKRDNHQCQFPNCYMKDDLTVHHIDYRKKHTTDDNCVTLCRKHNLFVNKIEERPIWEAYFKRLIHYKLSRRAEK